MDYKIDEPTSTKKDLGELLVEEKLITPEQLEKAYAIQASQGGSLGEILLKQGLVKPEDLAMVQSILLNIPFIDLKRHSVQPRALRLIPEEMARKHTLIPLDIIDDALVVVMADPQDVRTIADIRAQAKMRIEAALGIRADIERAIDLNYRSASTIEKQVNQAAPAPITLRTREAERLMANTPVAEMLNTILTQAIKDRASDIHIEPQEDRLRIRVRIDGILHDMYSLPTSIHDQLVSRIKILADMDIAEQRRPQDGQFSFTLDNKQVDIRVSTLDTPNGERVSLRILDKSLALFTLAEL
ncbi:MAG: ATPase, T2SS/T4P/T4SS family, partial [candidate division WOR-3 bacterium]